MRDCPKCTAPIANDAICCNACGWAKPGTKPAGPTAVGGTLDPMRWNCVDVLDGQRCAKPGVYNASTQGGPNWYCADHFPPFRNMLSGRRAEPTEAFRAIVKRMTMRPVGELIEDQESRLEREAIQAEGNGTMRLGAR